MKNTKSTVIIKKYIRISLIKTKNVKVFVVKKQYKHYIDNKSKSWFSVSLNFREPSKMNRSIHFP